MTEGSLRKSATEHNLGEAGPGSRVKVVHIKGRGAARRRILDMGMVPGAEVKVIRKAPMGDPIEFEVKNYKLSMRKSFNHLILLK